VLEHKTQVSLGRLAEPDRFVVCSMCPPVPCGRGGGKVEILGRGRQCGQLDVLLTNARDGVGGVFVVRGDAGVGKTVLLDYARAAAADLRVVSLVGVESESGLPFAALHRLIVPFLPRLERLSDSHRRALLVACGLSGGPPAGRHLVGLAMLSLLSDAATEGAILLCIDDAQWLDKESIDSVAFVARRMQADALAILLAVRTGAGEIKSLDGLPVLEVVGLEALPALELLRSAVSGLLDARIARGIVDATGGNPLALIELGQELSTQQLAGGTLLPEPAPLGGQLEAHYLARVHALPSPSQAWMLVAAAEPGGDITYVTEACAALGVSADASAAAEEAGLVTIRDHVRFRHPLTRSAVYGGASDVDRRRSHEALAGATARGSDVDRRAWHLAAATVGHDENVALELERRADRAADRGGYAARTRFLVRAAELTPDPRIGAGRMLSAAEAAVFAGSARQASALIECIDPGQLHGDWLGRSLMVLSETAIALGEPGGEARSPALCLAAAEAFGSPLRASEALLRACEHAVSAEQLIEGTDVAAIAAAARAALPSDQEQPATTTSLLLDAFSMLVLDGYAAAVPSIRRALSALLDSETSEEDVLAHFLLGVTLCTVIWDDAAREQLLDRVAGSARRTGALWELDTILYCASMAETTLGHLDRADAYLIEGHQLRVVIGATADQWDIYQHPELLAWHAGNEDVVRATLEGTAQAAAALGMGVVVSIADLGWVILDIGRGRYAEAFARARRLVQNDPVGVHSRVLPELIEAASRAGDRVAAARALRILDTRARVSGTPWALGLLARSEALLAHAERAEARFEQAISLLTSTQARSDLARAHLLFGEWLRRQKRRRDAREHLGQALAYFQAVNANAFAERARRELLATGAQPDAVLSVSGTDLTPQESAISRLASDGATNAEIASRLFISASTVDYHLRKTFRKLDITSRRELRSALRG
jgi:DNA-binding CsgD family transcriptional regulator